MNDELITDATLKELVIELNLMSFFRYGLFGKCIFFQQEIYNVTRRNQNAIVKCEAQNLVGISSDTETLDIICKYQRKILY